MSFSISKPPMFKRADKLSRNPKNMRAALQELRKRPPRSLVDLAMQSQYVRKAEAPHLRDDLFDQSTGWWAGLGNIEAVVRKALIKAGQLSLRHKLPSDSYLVYGGEKFEVVICKSERQLTVFFILPLPPPKPSVPPAPLKMTRRPVNVYRFS